MIRGAIAALIVLAATLGNAGAATFGIEGDTITMRGEIVATDPLRLAELIARGPSRIDLDSPGGIVAAGAYMADMIRAARLATIVRGDCASACTIMFYAGVSRELTGRLGFHRATDSIGTRTYATKIRSFGAPPEAIRAVTTTPPGAIVWLR